jgi:hypothetical protein
MPLKTKGISVSSQICVEQPRGMCPRASSLLPERTCSVRRCHPARFPSGALAPGRPLHSRGAKPGLRRGIEFITSSTLSFPSVPSCSLALALGRRGRGLGGGGRVSTDVDKRSETSMVASRERSAGEWLAHWTRPPPPRPPPPTEGGGPEVNLTMTAPSSTSDERCRNDECRVGCRGPESPEVDTFDGEASAAGRRYFKISCRMRVSRSMAWA